MSGTRFCALESVERGESFLGTATVAGCHLLVECGGSWPSSVEELLSKSGLPRPLAGALRAFVDWCPEPVHPLLIRQPGRRGARRIYVVRSDRSAGRCLTFDGDGADVLAALQGAYADPGPLGDLALVCTHGKKDKCCAKLGEPVYDRFRTELAGRFETFQCSHVGGDRFAANVLWLPHGIVLGHVHTDLDATIEALRAGSIPLRKLRGNASFPSAAQVLDGHWRSELGLASPGGIELIEHTETEVEGRQLSAVSLRIEALERVVRGFVSIHRAALPVLASCNRNGMGHPRVFERIDADAYRAALTPSRRPAASPPPRSGSGRPRG